MSFILEALRKSESERQRLGTAAIADLPIGRRPRGQPWWVFALSALLLINMIVLLVVLLRDRSPQTQIANAAQQQNIPTSAPVTSATTPVQNAAVASVAIPDAANISSAARSLQETAATNADVQYETVPRSELEIANAAASVPDGPTLVRSATAPNTETRQDLHIDLHVYSKNTQERFVLINMQRYTEGQRLPNGATVEQITPEGVLLYQNGTRYKLDRQ